MLPLQSTWQRNLLQDPMKILDQFGKTRIRLIFAKIDLLAAVFDFIYKLISQTRDIVGGKGDMDNTWFQIEICMFYESRVIKMRPFKVG